MFVGASGHFFVDAAVALPLLEALYAVWPFGAFGTHLGLPTFRIQIVAGDRSGL